MTALKKQNIEKIYEGAIEDKALGMLPTWDLSEFYNSPQDPKIFEDLHQIARNAQSFENAYKGRLETLIKGENAAQKLTNAILEYEDIQDKMGRIHTFTGLLYAQKTTDPERAKLNGDITAKSTEISKHLVFFELELNALTDEMLLPHLNQAPLNKYAPWLKDIRLEKPYQLEEKLEQLFLAKSQTSRTAWVRLFDETIAGLTVEIEGEHLPLEAALHKLSDKNPKAREAAAHALAKLFKAQRGLFTHIFNTVLKDKSISDEWRGYKDFADSRHLANRVEGEVVEALATAVRQAYPKLSHRYYALKAKWLGQQKLNYWDRNAPLNESSEALFPYSEAVTKVLSAYEDFSPKLREIAEPFFENRWVDVPNVAGKSTGAFAHSSVPSAHPFLMLNYLGKSRDVMTLAHELGHGVHQRLAAKQGLLMAQTPLTLAETASVFGEMLTFQKLLKEAPSQKEKKALLAGKVEDMLNTVVRQIAFYTFERKIHEARKNGELTADQLSSLWLEVQGESLGEAITLNEGYENYWVYIGHFIHAPFYVYAYAFGDCLVNALYALYEEGHEGFEEKYFALLEAGGAKHYGELLAPFGLNPKDPSFWAKGLSRIEAMISELERMP